MSQREGGRVSVILSDRLRGKQAAYMIFKSSLVFLAFNGIWAGADRQRSWAGANWSRPQRGGSAPSMLLL